MESQLDSPKQIIPELNKTDPPQNALVSQFMDNSLQGCVTRGRSRRINNINNSSGNGETSNKLPGSVVTNTVDTGVDQAESSESLSKRLSTPSQPTPQSPQGLASSASTSLARSPTIPTRGPSNNLASASQSKQHSKDNTASPLDDMEPLTPTYGLILVPSYKSIPVGSDILSDLRRQLNELHKDIIDLDGDYWVLTGMFEKTSGKIMETHGWKSSRENHKPIFNLETEVESLKDIAIAYGKMSDLDEEKIDQAHALTKRFDTAAKDFADLKKTLVDLRIDLEGDAIIQYPTRSEYSVIGNQPNHPRQFYKDLSGQWVQNGTIRKVSPSKQKPIINAIRTNTPTASLIRDVTSPCGAPGPSKMMGAAEAAINRFIKGREIRRTRHGSTSSLGQHTTTADISAQSTLQDTIDKLKEQNRELEMDKADLTAQIRLHSRQSKGTTFANIEQLTEENRRLSDANTKLQNEKRILEKENFILKNSGEAGVSLGKHPRSTQEELDEFKTKKRKLEREVKELEYKKEDLEDNIKALEMKMA